MSSFTFGTQGTATSVTPAATGNLFGTQSKPLFGTSVTAAQTTGGSSSFEAPASLVATSTMATGSLIATGVATTLAACGPFGNTSVTATPGLFGATPTTTATIAGSLFGKPTT
ncbi:unnamed protein product, partial [Litomosoides sigmodontis]